MEFVEGESLEERLKRGPMREADALKLVLTLARALRHAWERHGLLHGDLKPGNIMIAPDGTAKLLNLGLHQVFMLGADKADITCDAHYLAPERAMQQPISLASDIYALGGMIYQMITGTTPYEGADREELVARHYHDPVPDPRAVDATISDGSARLVASMMAKDPAARPLEWKAVALTAKRLLKAQHGMSTENLNTQEITRLRIPLSGAAAAAAAKRATGSHAAVTLPTTGTASEAGEVAAAPGKNRRWLAITALAVVVIGGITWWATRPSLPPPDKISIAAPGDQVETEAMRLLGQKMTEIRDYVEKHPEDVGLERAP